MPAQLEYHPTKVFVTVKTYPHPSENSIELVCCAGITDQHELVRIYPVDFRYLESNKRFSKYQWIEIALAQRPRNKDWRKESKQPQLGTLKLGNKVGTGTTRDWRDRSALVDRVEHRTMLELQKMHTTDSTSLGIVRPTEVLDLEVETCDDSWSASQKMILSRANLFGETPKPLHKIPYTFRYVFRCSDDTDVCRCSITDWELGMLFLNQRERHDEKIAVSHVKERFLDYMCAADKDTRFFVGTMLPRNNWLVLGVFWPPTVP